jgi:hypothetical protein
MKYKDLTESNSDLITEAGQLLSIANWFKDKYGSVLKRIGEKETKSFVNQHQRFFLRWMGRFRAEWSTITMNVVYQYMHSVNKLSDMDIVDVVNKVLKEPETAGDQLTIAQIRDHDRSLLVSSLSKVPKSNQGQIITEKMIASGSMRQLEQHWSQQASAQYGRKSVKSAGSGYKTQSGPPVARTAEIDSAISQLEKL